MTVLKVSGLTKNFGGLAAVSNVNLEIEERELIGLIGPNGAGKTTLFNLLTGVYDPSEGKIELNVDGTMKSIGGLKPYVITGLGLARTFQNIRLFKNMTVLDNVKLAMNKSVNYSTLAAILRLPSYYREEQRVLEEAVKLLEVVGLAEKQTTLAKNLPYGQQRKLEIARALAAKPKILFLDEPAAGMNPQETTELTELIHQIKEQFNLTAVSYTHLDVYKRQAQYESGQQRQSDRLFRHRRHRSGSSQYDYRRGIPRQSGDVSCLCDRPDPDSALCQSFGL